MNAPTLSFLGRYRLVKVLGQGAMGVVYEAEDARLGRTVAIKTVLRSHMIEETTAVEFSRRFEREAQAAARLSHPNIVTVYDFGEHEDVAYIVMEFVRGRELGQLFAAGEKFTLHDTVRIMGELLAALDVAHRQGVVHRDIKPANVLIDGAGHVKLTDFGVARVTAAGQNRTMPGTLVGTPSYMSPEQILGLPVGSRADIFAAGVILYQFLTGQRPFVGGGPFAVQRKIVQDPAPPPSQINPAVPPAFDAIVERALAKQPEQRYESAAAFAADLEHALVGVPPPAAAVDLDLADGAEVPPPSPPIPGAGSPPQAAPARAAAAAVPPELPTVPPSAWASTQWPAGTPATAPPALRPPSTAVPPPAESPTSAIARTAAADKRGPRRTAPVAEPAAPPGDPDATVILLRTAVPGTAPAPPTLQPPVPAPASPMARAPATPPRAAAAASRATAAGTRAASRSPAVAAAAKPAASRPAAAPPRRRSSLWVPVLAVAGVTVAVLVLVLRPWSDSGAPPAPAATVTPPAGASPAVTSGAPPQAPPVPVETPAVAAGTTSTRPADTAAEARSGTQATTSRPPPAAGVTTVPAPDTETAPARTPAPAAAVTPPPSPAPAPRRAATEAARTPAPSRPAAPPYGVDARCGDLLQRMQLGEPLSTEQTSFFQTHCTR